jgi:hypothetical protein
VPLGTFNATGDANLDGDYTLYLIPVGFGVVDCGQFPPGSPPALWCSGPGQCGASQCPTYVSPEFNAGAYKAFWFLACTYPIDANFFAFTGNGPDLGSGWWLSLSIYTAGHLTCGSYGGPGRGNDETFFQTYPNFAWKFPTESGWACNNGSNLMTAIDGTAFPGWSFAPWDFLSAYVPGNLTVVTKAGSASMLATLGGTNVDLNPNGGVFPDTVYLTVTNQTGFPCSMSGSFALAREFSNGSFPNYPSWVDGSPPFAGPPCPSFLGSLCTDSNRCVYTVELTCGCPDGPYALNIFSDSGAGPVLMASFAQTGQECNPFMILFDYSNAPTTTVDCLGNPVVFTFKGLITE